MAQISSKLEADFSEFVAETKKANAALSEMQTEATKTADAMEKGSVVVGKFGGAAASTESGFTSMATGLQTADKTLGAFGVHIGSEISALQELGEVSGKTAGQIGLIGTAASVVGAAMAGWQIGRKIAELTGADAKIADFVSTLMGWGSASKEAASAQDAMINRARQLGYAGNDAAAALQFINKAEKDRQETFNTGEQRLATWIAELNDADTDLAGLRKEIEAGNSTVAQMAQHYHASAGAVEYLQKQMAQEAQKRKEVQTAAQAQADAYNEVQTATKGQQAVLATLTTTERDAVEAALAGGAAQGVVAKAYGLTATQVRAVADSMKDTEDAVKQFDAAQKIVSEQNQAWNEEVLTRSGTTTQGLIANVERWRTQQIAALDATKGATQAHYDAIEQITGEKLAEINVNWDTLKEGSIASLADQAARAEATYAQMAANSTAYTVTAIENARKLRDETAAALLEGQTGMKDQFTRNEELFKSLASSTKQSFAETSDWLKAGREAVNQQIERYAIQWGVSTDVAAQRLNLVGDAGQRAMMRIVDEAKRAQEAVMTLTPLLQESSAELQTLAQHYQELARENAQQGGTGAFWSPFQMSQFYEQRARELRGQAGERAQYENAVLGGAAWSRGPGITGTTNLNVNVNNQTADDIAQRLITEMRHAGVNFG